ncbi:MAG: hypothetical protein QXW97_02075 [Candidatus Pacearchaeota archaeon]
MKINEKYKCVFKLDNKKIRQIFYFVIFLILIHIPLINSQSMYSSSFNDVSSSSSSFNVQPGSSSFSGKTYGGSSFSGGVYGASIGPQFNNPGFYIGPGFVSPEVYWPKFNKEDCFERADFIMQIAPGGCTPAVVRSDLLEEQDVPVFCKVMSVTVNPLIDVSRIRSIYFRGNNPAGVSGISYFPARAALNSQQTLISSPINDNLGYVVIVLSRKQSEKDMPDFIEGNITAVVDYDVQGAFGIGNTNFYINEMSDEEWYRNYKQYGFWNGKGYIRADSIEPDKATISIYRDSEQRIYSITLKKGETSGDIYLNGFYCAAGLNLRLENIGAPVDSALLQINDQQIWVSRGDRLMNNRCTVTNLEAYNNGGKISISCPVRNGRIDLSLNSGRANLSVNGLDYKLYSIGDVVKLGNENEGNWYLGYVGQDYKGNDFVVIVQDEYSDTYYEFSDKDVFNTVQGVLSKSTILISEEQLQKQIKEAIIKQYTIKLRGISSVRGIEDKLKVCITTKESSDCGISIADILTAKDRVWDLTKEDEKITKEYYDWAIKYYEDLISLYPGEKRVQGSSEDSYSAMALYEAAIMSRRFGMNEKSQEYLNKLLRDYPNTFLANKVARDVELLNKYGSSNSRATVQIGTDNYFVELLDFKKPTRFDASATLLINGKETEIGLNEIINIGISNGSSRNIQLSEINTDYVVLKYSKTALERFYTSSDYKTERLNLHAQTDVDGVRVKLVNINLKEQAKISIIPKMFGPRSEANFTFRIGIEKRAIKLSTQQTKDLIENLKKNIKEWENINNKLGKIVSSMKGACFATSAMLTVKNLVNGWSGESMARKEVMTKSGGWNEFCEKLVSDKTSSPLNGKSYTDSTVQKCLLDHDSYISKDVEIYKNQIEKTNDLIKQIQKQVGIQKTDILDMTGQVDSRKVEDEFAKKFKEFCLNSKGSITLPDAFNTTINLGKEGGMCDWDTLTQEQRRQIMTLVNTRDSISSLGGSSILQNMIDKDLGRVVLDSKNFWENEGARRRNEEERKKNNMGIRAIVPGGDRITYGDIKIVTKGDSNHNIYKNYNVGQAVILINVPFRESYAGHAFEADSEVAGKQVTVPLIRQPGGDYTVDPKGEIYLVESGKLVSDNGARSVRDYMSLKGIIRFRESNAKVYQNKILNPEDMRVKYFERAPYKGLPAEVPFDVENGWYVELTYELSGFGRPYDESGRVVNFWICNVGPNGAIDFQKSLDDICRYYNGQATGELGFGIDPSEERNLIMRAQQAIYDAAKQYGKDRVIINGYSFKSGTAFGGEQGRCSDFMSPSDCNILFNVCDPVMCPSSRCDLGGEFRVDNVVQTGIIGSLLLCLPNYKEGIVVPICLSGVHAGIEGYISIMNSTVACLNESLTTGRNIGICDEIKSIYLCEFFWKQATPLMNILIPRMVESFYGQGVRGGGEYSTVQEAWNNMQSSIKYFTNEYAVNSMTAFQARSIDSVGSEICKSFNSVTYPSSKDFFDRLIEPDSPVQFTGWFSEDQYTTATIPATSHYKVYFHIYAGKDQGAYYTVYLKDVPPINNIFLNQIYVVDRGYVSRGSQVDRAIDFTGVSGYKQMCININGKDECGFGKVSTSFLINSISDAYAEEQANTLNIKTSKECVAGTPSLISAINPSLQQGAQDIIDPQMYNYGIIRVCSTENPGKRVLPSGEFDTTNSTFDRWKEVGYCDDPTIKCWLDTSSVKNVIKNKGILNKTLQNIDLNVLGEIDFWTPEQSTSVAAESQKEIESLIINPGENKLSIENKISPIVKKLRDLSNLGPSNKYRARGLYLLANLYRKVAESLVQNNQIAIIPPSEVNFPSSSTSSEASSNSRNSVSNTEWTDDKLRYNVDIIVTFKKTGQTIKYRYINGKEWLTNDKDIKQNTGYVDGINLIVNKLNKEDFVVIEGDSFIYSNQTKEQFVNELFKKLAK